jgi:hypothetical protein
LGLNRTRPEGQGPRETHTVQPELHILTFHGNILVSKSEQ